MLLELLVEKKRSAACGRRQRGETGKYTKTYDFDLTSLRLLPPLHHPKAPPKQEEEEWKEKLETLGRFEDCSFPPFDSERDI
jgi:hypothetical protein